MSTFILILSLQLDKPPLKSKSGTFVKDVWPLLKKCLLLFIPARRHCFVIIVMLIVLYSIVVLNQQKSESGFEWKGSRKSQTRQMRDGMEAHKGGEGAITLVWQIDPFTCSLYCFLIQSAHTHTHTHPHTHSHHLHMELAVLSKWLSRNIVLIMILVVRERETQISRDHLTIRQGGRG